MKQEYWLYSVIIFVNLLTIRDTSTMNELAESKEKWEKKT